MFKVNNYYCLVYCFIDNFNIYWFVKNIWRVWNICNVIFYLYVYQVKEKNG